MIGIKNPFPLDSNSAVYKLYKIDTPLPKSRFLNQSRLLFQKKSNQIGEILRGCVSECLSKKTKVFSQRFS